MLAVQVSVRPQRGGLAYEVVGERQLLVDAELLCLGDAEALSGFFHLLVKSPDQAIICGLVQLASKEEVNKLVLLLCQG